MAKKTLITSLIIISIFLLSFLIWHFFLSIYEVKYKRSSDGSNINCNSEITIETIGVNSLGWELPFRSIESKVEITNGQDLVFVSQAVNSIKVKILEMHGEFSIKVIPKYSLNPTMFSYQIVHFKQQ